MPLLRVVSVRPLLVGFVSLSVFRACAYCVRVFLRLKAVFLDDF